MATGLSPSHAFLIMLVNDHPGILQKKLCAKLNLAPSTVTRFIDTLVHRGFLVRETKGKSTMVFPTEAGVSLQDAIHAAWESLHARYAEVLGLEEGDDLTARVDKASIELGKTV